LPEEHCRAIKQMVCDIMRVFYRSANEPLIYGDGHGSVTD